MRQGTKWRNEMREESRKKRRVGNEREEQHIKEEGDEIWKRGK